MENAKVKVQNLKCKLRVYRGAQSFNFQQIEKTPLILINLVPSSVGFFYPLEIRANFLIFDDLGSSWLKCPDNHLPLFSYNAIDSI
jgi:hypothetical protein